MNNEMNFLFSLNHPESNYSCRSILSFQTRGDIDKKFTDLKDNETWFDQTNESLDIYKQFMVNSSRYSKVNLGKFILRRIQRKYCHYVDASIRNIPTQKMTILFG